MISSLQASRYGKSEIVRWKWWGGAATRWCNLISAAASSNRKKFVAHVSSTEKQYVIKQNIREAKLLALHRAGNKKEYAVRPSLVPTWEYLVLAIGNLGTGKKFIRVVLIWAESAGKIVNPPDHWKWRDELWSVIGNGIHFIMMPKGRVPRDFRIT